MNRSNTDEHDHFAPPPPTRRTCSSRRTASRPPRPPSRLGSKAGVHRKEYTFPRISMAHRESCYPQIEFLRLLTHCHANASLDSWRVLSAIRKTKGKRRRRKGNALFFFFLGAVGRLPSTNPFMFRTHFCRITPSPVSGDLEGIIFMHKGSIQGHTTAEADNFCIGIHLH